MLRMWLYKKTNVIKQEGSLVKRLSLQVSIEAEDNSVEVWKTFSSLFDKSDDVSAYYLEKNIFELNPTNFDRVEFYLAEVKTLNEKLNNCGKYYKKTDTALIIIVEQNLPSCFDMFIQTRNRALELSQSTTKPAFYAFVRVD